MHCVEYQGKICFAVVLADGLQAIAVCDKEYPSRVALAMLKDLVNEVKSGELACVSPRARSGAATALHGLPAHAASSSSSHSTTSAAGPSGGRPQSRAAARWHG